MLTRQLNCNEMYVKVAHIANNTPVDNLVRNTNRHPVNEQPNVIASNCIIWSVPRRITSPCQLVTQAVGYLWL